VFIPPVLGTTRLVTMANPFLGSEVRRSRPDALPGGWPPGRIPKAMP